MILGSQLVVPGLSSGGSSLPTGFVGVIMDWPGTAAPTGWVLAFGQSLLRASFPALFAAIGTTYGAADGTHFNVPDLRGRIAAGKDNMGGVDAARLNDGGVTGTVLGSTGGISSQTLSISQLPSHSHPYNYPTFNSANADTTGLGATAAFFQSQGSDNSPDTSTVGDGATHNNVQPTIVLNKIIYTGV